MSTTLEQISEQLARIQLLAEQISDRARVSGSQIVVVEGLSDIDGNLGLIKAGEFRSGTGDPGKGTGFTGVRIGSPGWTYSSVRYSIIGLNDDTLQFGLSNDDGAIYAGGGDVTINANGINLQSALSDSLRFIHSTGHGLLGHKPGSGLVLSTYSINNGDADDNLQLTSTHGQVLSYAHDEHYIVSTHDDVLIFAGSSDSNLHYVSMYCRRLTGYISDVTGCAADADSIAFQIDGHTRTFNTGSYTELDSIIFSSPAWSAGAASTVTRSATVTIDGAPSLTNFTATRNYALDVVGGAWIESGGLDLHNGTGAGNGSMSYSGDLLAYRNSTNYTGFIFVPLITPLTSTSWDGDAYSTVGTSTQLDLSTVFSAPAGIKAVLLQIIVNDSGGAGDYYFSCGGSSTYWYAATSRSVSASYNNEELCIVPCDANGDVWYRIGASGSGTLHVWLRIFGYWI